MTKDRYYKIREKAKKYYRSIGSVVCPVLGNERIFFNETGFRHLIMKRGEVRLISDQIRRFKLIAYAPYILINSKNSKHSQILRTVKPAMIQYWSISHMINNREVIVLVRQINNGQKHFFSIMKKGRALKAKTP